MNNEEKILTHARAQMMYDANRKSAGVAYVLLIFLGLFGAHRFYLQRVGTACIQLALGLLGFVTLLLTWIPLAVWLFVDMFLVPSLVRQENMKLVDRFAAPLG